MPDLFSGTQYVHAPKETLRLPSEMRTIYKKIWGWLILFACSLPLVALPQKDSVCLYFPKGYATWNPTYRDNDVTFKNLRSRLEKLRADSSSYLVELHISGNASPDGLTSANVKLSGKRAATILKLLRDYIGEFYQFNLSSCIRQQNSLTAQFVSFSLSNLANIFYPPQFLQ